MTAPSFPDWIEPMAATLTQERFMGSAWIFERKLDGVRLLAFKNGPEIRLLSRTACPRTSRPSQTRSRDCRRTT
jgi:ATP-dependent DNA ligase